MKKLITLLRPPSWHMRGPDPNRGSIPLESMLLITFLYHLLSKWKLAEICHGIHPMALYNEKGM